MKLRCPKCQTVNTFEDGEALRCDSCGFDGKRIDGITAAAVEGQGPGSSQVTAPPATRDIAEPVPATPLSEVTEPAASEWPQEEGQWDESSWPEEDTAAQAQRTDGFSIAGLVLGILGVSLLAIIFGAVGISRCNKNAELKGKGMAIAGLVLGIVWLIVSIALAYLSYATSVLDGYI